MGKILTIPDLHGKYDWKSVVSPEFEKIVFLGDYVDSFHHSGDDIYNNLLDIIEFKKQNPDQVVLLPGNHDIQYIIPETKYRCSGFREQEFSILHHTFAQNIKLFQFAYQHNNYLWTHAGVHCGWWRYRFPYDTTDNIGDKLNIAFQNKLDYIGDSKSEALFDCGPDRYGKQKHGGPLWVDKNTLWNKGMQGYHQIVGHTACRKIQTCTNKKHGSVTFCDCLDVVLNFHTIDV